MARATSWMAGLVLAAALVVAGTQAGARRAGNGCLACHAGVESAGAGHAMACAVCHLAPAHRGLASPGHDLVIPNPSHLDHARVQCGPCHAREVEAVEASRHATLAGIINQTRYLWGAQQEAEPPVYGLGGALRPLPEPVPRPRTPAMLVDGFLRARCLGCHIGRPGRAGPERYRAAGCAACHGVYAGDGLYHGRDAAVDRSVPGRPVRHGLTAAVGDAACLGCHHGNHAGADFHGLFERDDAAMFQRAVSWGRPVSRRHGRAVHVLARDVHARRGMGCLDCHGGAQVMGLESGTPPSCRGCHGGHGRSVPDTSLDGVAAGMDGFVFCRRDQKLVALPTAVADTPGHDPSLHGRVACFACHAQWVFGDYGLSVSHRGDAAGNAWRADYRFRRWEVLVLGVDRHDRIVPLRPRHQYLVSHVDGKGRVVLDSVAPSRGDGRGRGWASSPCVPHTTAPRGRPCHECHGNAEVAGLGPGWDAGADMLLLRASPPVPGDGRLLDDEERRRLMEPGRSYRKAFALHVLGLLEGGLPEGQ